MVLKGPVRSLSVYLTEGLTLVTPQFSGISHYMVVLTC